MNRVIKYALVFFIIDVLGTVLYLYFMPASSQNRVVFPIILPLICMVVQAFIGIALVGAKYKEPGQGIILAAGISFLIGLAVCGALF